MTGLMRDARRRAAAQLDRHRVLSVLMWLRERWILACAPAGSPYGPARIRIPPPRLRLAVDGHADPERFRTGGIIRAQLIDETLGRAGVDLQSLDSILDFACGCGRVGLHWASLRGPELHACDHDPAAVAWCQQNLGFIETKLTATEPPAPYRDGQFGLICAVSVFTHLTERTARAWVLDFTRMLRPGGLLLLTTHGEAYTDRLAPREHEVYRRGLPVVQRSRLAGTYWCAAVSPPSYVHGTLLGDLELVSFEAAGPSAFFQDVHLARKLDPAPNALSAMR
jgi:SAM-dependent methyltransferase